MNERELASYFEARRGDTSTWSATPIKATVRRGDSVVFSLRLRPEELEALRTIAEQFDITVSDLIRSSVADMLVEDSGSRTIRTSTLPPATIAVRDGGSSSYTVRGSRGSGESAPNSIPSVDFVIRERSTSSRAAA